MNSITSDTTLAELAALVSGALEKAGIVATLSGGAAVSLYSNNRYQSSDLDFVTAALRDEIAQALAPLGFVHTGKPRLSVFEHPDTDWYLEFPAAPLSFGSTYIDPAQCARLQTPAGEIRIITPTHSVMDRLSAAAFWPDPQALEQAKLVATDQEDRIDWEQIDRWVLTEDIASSPAVATFYRSVGRQVPQQV